jgi:hypothetical protein
MNVTPDMVAAVTERLKEINCPVSHYEDASFILGTGKVLVVLEVPKGKWMCMMDPERPADSAFQSIAKTLADHKI